ncbi:MAG TPA: putative toxin-antitoxin system toxin component, PIN family [Anaerolineae bacterium]|nr:putative toxin-antitoxin system toxin component, PIN family [Anaerolineae bacterium]HQJ51223.1 putative toxin-antitoxin system toxin component, PIN family [Anaerolineae bacterium]
MPIRAVIDTHLLAHGLLHPLGPAHDVIDAWLAGRFTQVTCVCLADELRHILTHPPISAKLALTRQQVDQFLAALLSESDVVPGNVELSVLDRFPQYDTLLSCAVEGYVNYLVTADLMLLSLGEYVGFPILTPESFMNSLKAQS